MTYTSIFNAMHMTKVTIIAFAAVCLPLFASAQPYTSYFMGDTTDVTTASIPGTVLMGGATENDNAMRWFLERAAGGDVVVLRTTGDDGYNDYFYSGLGVTINSVETIVCTDPSSGSDPYVIARVQQAEALWFAGGDQWDYISYWRDTPLEDAINNLINVKHIPIGGTSAGCAIQGQAYFSAENGTITSTQALHDPYHNLMQLGYNDFIDNPATQAIITDTHYDNPDRRGRHMTFLARLYQETGIEYRGIGVEEYTAVCIDENNIAHIYGSYPDFEDYAYFLQVNCVMPNTPETCVDGSNLTWDRDHAAVKVIKIAGQDDGAGTVDLNDWKTAAGATFTWDDWWVDNAIFDVVEAASPIECDTTISVNTISFDKITIYPNPADAFITIIGEIINNASYAIYAMDGSISLQGQITDDDIINVATLPSGIYVITIYAEDAAHVQYFMKQ